MAMAEQPGENQQPKEATRSNEAECLDYGLSFICNEASFNAVRFWVESRTTLIDTEAGTSQVFYQCGSCKSEHTFAAENLFIEDNYDFLPILGGAIGCSSADHVASARRIAK